MNSIPFITTEQMIEVDRWMIEEYQILLIQMMENAGRGLATLARSRFLDGKPLGKKVAVLVGKGGNGGGGLVCARHLHNWGAHVQVFTIAPGDQYEGVPAHQLSILQNLGISVQTPGANLSEERVDLVIDAVIGYSLAGNPRGRAADLIEWANTQAAPVLSLDVPSGVDASNGVVYSPAVAAEATLTLALPKTGLKNEDVQKYVGELYLGDISVPPQLFKAAGLDLDIKALFGEEEIIQIW